MPFQSGQSGNPTGRPKGSIGGRAMALRALDDLLAEETTLEDLKAAMRADFKKNPVRFFQDIIMPLLPKQAVLDIAGGGVVTWTSLLDSAQPLPGRHTLPDASTV